jgi:hypothetical protein
VTIWYFCGYLVYFSSFGMLYQEKSGNPGAGRQTDVDPRLIAIVRAQRDAL